MVEVSQTEKDLFVTNGLFVNFDKLFSVWTLQD